MRSARLIAAILALGLAEHRAIAQVTPKPVSDSAATKAKPSAGTASEPSERRKAEIQATIDRRKAAQAGASKNRARRQLVEKDRLQLEREQLQADYDLEMARIRSATMTEVARQQAIAQAAQVRAEQLRALTPGPFVGTIVSPGGQSVTAVGTLQLPPVTAAAMSTGVVLVDPSGSVLELDVNASGLTIDALRRLEGRPAIATGAWSVRTNWQGSARRVLAVTSLTPAGGGITPNPGGPVIAWPALKP